MMDLRGWLPRFICISWQHPEPAAPLMAAARWKNINMIKLLIDQADFVPIGRCNGQTYQEIAWDSQGLSNGKEEEYVHWNILV